VAVGNTDAVKGCYSYGKFVLIKHNNGLSTLYAHLSFASVKKGDTVITSDVIGYSGNTGYSTGPHLHFTVYASQGVQIVRYGDYKAKTNCADANIPVAPLNAYLNPIDYL
jgi:murein DD-endopeptidase MepM/ murein hydrolase activator NlpD